MSPERTPEAADSAATDNPFTLAYFYAETGALRAVWASGPRGAMAEWRLPSTAGSTCAG